MQDAATPPTGRRTRLPARAAAVAALVATSSLLAACAGDPAPAAVEPAPGPAGSGLQYVALGDSYTAAPGVPETSTETFCLRSDSNYPALVADELDADLVDASCSGATTEHMLTPQAFGGNTQPPQFDALPASADLVTVGIGGNDFNIFGTLIGTCSELAEQASSTPGGDPCRTRMQLDGSDDLLDHVRQVRGRIGQVLRGVQQRAPEALVVVVGYPQLVPEVGACSALPLAPGDYDYARAVNLALTRALEGAAADAGARYVDLWTASEGHDICAPDPWINGEGMADTALPFHPYPAEQEAAAALVLAEVDGLL